MCVCTVSGSLSVYVSLKSQWHICRGEGLTLSDKRRCSEKPYRLWRWNGILVKHFNSRGGGPVMSAEGRVNAAVA